MKETRLSIRISPEEKAVWEQTARQQDVSFTQFVKEALQIRAGFTPYFQDMLKSFSTTMNVSQSIIIQNLVLSWMARQNADSDTGQGTNRLLEFVFTPDGPITGEPLYEILNRHFIEAFKQKKTGSESPVLKAQKLSKQQSSALRIACLDTTDINFQTNKGSILRELKQLLAMIKAEEYTASEKEVELKVFGRKMKRLYYKQSSMLENS